MDFIKTKTEDGISYTGLLSKSAKNSENIIIHIHGMSGDTYFNSFYPFMHAYYPENGWSFLAVEHRGTHSVSQFDKNGEVVNIGNTFEIFEESALDIKAWVNKAKELGYTKIWLQAHSLGPSKVAYYINTNDHKDVQGLIFLSPSDMIGLSYENEDTTKVHLDALEEAKQLIKDGKPRQLLSKEIDGNILSAQTYENFFGENAKDAIFNFKKPELGFEVVNSIDIPVIAFTGTKDDGIASVINPYKAMDMLNQELKNCPKNKNIVFEGANHDFQGFGQKIVEEVINFIQNC